MLSRSWMTNRCDWSPGTTMLLRRPRCRRVVRHVPVQDPPGAHLHDDEDVEHSKRRGDDHEEIAGEDASHVVSGKRAPVLHTWSTTRPSTGRHIAANGARRHQQPKLQQEFSGDPFLAPCPVRSRDIPDQLAQVGRAFCTVKSSPLTFVPKIRSTCSPGMASSGSMS